MDKNAFFWQIQDGKLPPPKAAATLGIRILTVSTETGTIEVEFEGKPEFTNPVGHIQGGFLAAMLDDIMGPLISSTLGAGAFAPTLNLNVSFAKPAVVDKLRGRRHIVRRGKKSAFSRANCTKTTSWWRRQPLPPWFAKFSDSYCNETTWRKQWQTRVITNRSTNFPTTPVTCIVRLFR